MNIGKINSAVNFQKLFVKNGNMNNSQEVLANTVAESLQFKDALYDLNDRGCDVIILSDRENDDGVIACLREENYNFVNNGRGKTAEVKFNFGDVESSLENLMKLADRVLTGELKARESKDITERSDYRKAMIIRNLELDDALVEDETRSEYLAETRL